MHFDLPKEYQSPYLVSSTCIFHANTRFVEECQAESLLKTLLWYIRFFFLTEARFYVINTCVVNIILSCKDAAQQVLMSMCVSLSIGPSIWVPSWNSAFLHPSTTSRMYQNVPECSRKKERKYAECMQKVPECMKKVPICM